MSEQTIILGDKHCQKLKSILHQHSAKRFLLVCGSSFQTLPIAHAFESLGIPYSIFNSFGSNPKYEDIVKGVDFFRSESCDFIVAVGGGSCLDVAKCIKLFSSLEPGSMYLKQEYKENSIPLLAIPTTAGTGSESTRYAIIYYRGEKHSVVHESLVPAYAILEPSVLEGLPLYQKKCTMLDAFCQAVESWWSLSATDESKAYAKKAVVLFLNHYAEFLANYSEGNEGMLLASNWAGQAINITQTTAPHAMSYKLSSLFSLPHGHAVALCFPVVWQYMLENLEASNKDRGEKYFEHLFNEIASTMGFSYPLQAITWFEKLLENLGITPPIDPDSSVLPKLVKSVNLDRLKNSPVGMDSETLERLYRQVLKMQDS
ncbi:alcohol dehydrogenase, class IV [Sphaerochaeta pleomorpha str. Grapes]|uniref:Alcohol dehydrogenase, class IV n=1 Tax=Sphaerochaeta pleomorpha (strain ATCC BAA-1885 / DSM 22778 / Grapes) TaxID=158190 RepID=G8QW97_SPHPG|nr:phosphonoacetaldehyde reductase [Sphaerochaeta pleomorpha]AEV29395.1 alcohol dehydrogenase, class IV [Sphaerochaeta pleomorpha str. Grapes]